MGANTHSCPGYCGRDVANARYACLPCWDRLPSRLRVAIAQTAGLGLLVPARRHALVSAAEWYKANRP